MNGSLSVDFTYLHPIYGGPIDFTPRPPVSSTVSTVLFAASTVTTFATVRQLEDESPARSNSSISITSTTSTTSSTVDPLLDFEGSDSRDENAGYSVLEVTVIAVIAGILSLLTILGNVLVMVSFKLDKQLQTISNYFLLSLAVADFFIGLISMPLYTLYLLMNKWPLGPVVCDIWLALDYLNSNASVLNLLVISFDRYFSVTRPLTYRVRRTTKRALFMIASTWIISLLLWPPWIFAWPYIEGKRTVPESQCYIQFLETNLYITFGTALAAFYIPVTIMCALYWRIWRETERRYKDLTTLFLVSAVGGKVRTTATSVDAGKAKGAPTASASTFGALSSKMKAFSRGSSRDQADNNSSILPHPPPPPSLPPPTGEQEGAPHLILPPPPANQGGSSYAVSPKRSKHMVTRASNDAISAGDNERTWPWRVFRFICWPLIWIKDRIFLPSSSHSPCTRSEKKTGKRLPMECQEEEDQAREDHQHQHHGQHGQQQHPHPHQTEDEAAAFHEDEAELDDVEVEEIRRIERQRVSRSSCVVTQRVDLASTAEDDLIEVDCESTSVSSKGGSGSRTSSGRGGLASDSIYTILITLGSTNSSSSYRAINNNYPTPTTTSSSAGLTPVTESLDGSSSLLTGLSIKQFFESAGIGPTSVSPTDSPNQSTATYSPAFGKEDPGTTIRSVSQSQTRRASRTDKRPTEKSSILTRMSSTSTAIATATGQVTGGSTGSSRYFQNRPAMHSTVSQPKSEKKAAKTLSAILLAFIITWTPYNVLVLVKTLTGDSINENSSFTSSLNGTDQGDFASGNFSSVDSDIGSQSSGQALISESLWSFSYALCYLNSTINPFCYALCNVNFRNTYLRILKCQWSVKDTRAKRAAANLDAQQGHRYQSHLKHQQLRHQAKRHGGGGGSGGQFLSSLADRSSDSTSLRVVTDVETDCNVKCGATEGEGASRGSVESKTTDRVTSKEVPSLARKKKLSKKM